MISKTIENKTRRILTRNGFNLIKGKLKNLNINKKYIIVNFNNEIIEKNSLSFLSFEDVQKFIKKYKFI